MGAIKPHKTAVDKTGGWDGPKAVADAPNDPAVLRYMHAWVNAKGDASSKGSYKFPHHRPGTDTPAVIAGVNNALSRLPQASIPAGDRAGVEAHLRKHRKDAGLEESMSEAEILEAVKHIKDVDDLKKGEAASLLEAISIQEQRNMGDWLEARIHMAFTEIADSMFGDGMMLRDERIALSSAISDALNAFRANLTTNAPQLYQRGPFDGAPENGGQPMSESTVELVEAGDGMFMPLMEKAVRRDGTIPIKIIQPGWGSSGYYPADVLERDGPQIFKKDLHMYWNHPTLTEETDRPERSLNDLAGVLVSDARWDPNGPKGAGLYADAKVFEAYQKPVDDLAENIGLSIRALGTVQQGSAEGRNGPIVTELNTSKSVDFVTAAGAGGEIISLFEAARTVRTDQKKTGTVPANENATHNVANNQSTTEEDMDMNELQEQVATLTTRSDELATENARLKEVNAIRDAKELVREALGSLTNLPEITKTRLIESLAKNPPMKDGALDKDVFAKVIEEAVKAEIKYLESVLGTGQIRGLGESQSEDEEEVDDAKIEESLAESFSELGLSEASVKVAAKGRK